MKTEHLGDIHNNGRPQGRCLEATLLFFLKHKALTLRRWFYLLLLKWSPQSLGLPTNLRRLPVQVVGTDTL